MVVGTANPSPGRRRPTRADWPRSELWAVAVANSVRSMNDGWAEGPGNRDALRDRRSWALDSSISREGVVLIMTRIGGSPVPAALAASSWSFSGPAFRSRERPKTLASPHRCAGIIGLDTSHVIAFTQRPQRPQGRGRPGRHPGRRGLPRRAAPTSRRAATAWPATPRSCARSTGSRSSIRSTTLLKKVDVVLLESVDGRPHLEQARPVFQAQKPVFIDKPVAGTLADAIAIFELAKETGTPCFSSSSLRFSPGIAGMREQPQGGRGPRLRRLRPLPPRGAPSRPLLVRRPRRRDAVHDHGDRLRVGQPDPDRGDRPGRRASGRAAGSARSAAFARARRTTGRPSSARRASPPAAATRAIEPLVVEICKFFRTGKPPGLGRGDASRSSPSWRPPTRASARGASR